jgi:hypothetical protein
VQVGEDDETVEIVPEREVNRLTEERRNRRELKTIAYLESFSNASRWIGFFHRYRRMVMALRLFERRSTSLDFRNERVARK